MRKYLRTNVWLIFLLFAAGACRSQPNYDDNARAAAKPVAGTGTDAPTVIYLVRHAEKEISDPDDQDPGLTAAGKQRAEDLKRLLENQAIDALYATKYTRTQNTLKPLADASQIKVEEYAAHDFNALKERIMQHSRGRTVVVAGHSNTLLPLMQAFGVKHLPLNNISDQEYDNIFKVTVAPDGTASVLADHYGALSR